MKRRFLHRALALLSAMCLGCASDGGVVGSGISASISGNVAAVDSGAAALRVAATATANVPGIRVTIDEVKNLADTTDDDGRFQLTGDFAGALTLRFTRNSQTLATLPIDVPAGADIDLDDIELRPSVPGGIQARQIRQRNVFGRVYSVKCAAGELAIDDDIGNLFRARLTRDTLFRIAPDIPAGCADIRQGGRVLVESIVLPDKVMQAVIVTIGPPPRPTRASVESAE